MEQPYFVPDTSRGAIPEVPILGPPREGPCSVELHRGRAHPCRGVHPTARRTAHQPRAHDLRSRASRGWTEVTLWREVRRDRSGLG